MIEEKNGFKEKAFEIVKEIKGTDNIFLAKNAELKAKLIAELESIVTIDIQEKVKKTLTRPILFVGDVYKSMLAGCYAHCVRKVEFQLNLLPKRLDEFSIKHFGNPVEDFEEVRQTSKDLSEIEGEFIFKDCFGQPIEKLWYGDDPAYCHASILNPNWSTYTQNTGIKNWIELYRLGTTLFLVCLEGKDSNECKEFVKNIRGMNYPKPSIPNKLIVHTNDINKLPGYFPEPFEVIRLDAGEQVKAVDTPKGNVFCWRGGTWEITFDGKIIRPTDSKGLRYIHYLMHYPSKQIHVLELVQIGVSSEKAKQSLIEKGKHAEIKGLNESSSEDDSEGDEPIDKLSIKKNGEDVVTDTLSVEEYERCLSYLKEQEESVKLTGDVEKLKETQEQIDQIEKILQTSQNKKGLPRKFAEETEKNRIAVYKCIKSSLDMIQKEHPSFYEHLKPPTVTTGACCSYTPTKEIPWILI